MNITITIPNLNTLIQRMNQYPAISEKHVNVAIDRSLVRILGEEKQTAPVDTGNLRDNWNVIMGRFEGSLHSNAKYSGYIEGGTGPAVGHSKYFPPVDAIAPWAKKRGIDPFLVARGIYNKGTKPNPFMARAIERASAGVNVEFRTALDGIMKEIAVK